MQSQNSSTTGDEIENVSDPLDIEAADQDWKSVSNSQSAADAAPITASLKESIPAAASPAVRSPQPPLRGEKITDSLSSSVPTARPAPSPRTSKRPDSQNTAASPVQRTASPRLKQAPAQSPTPQTMPTKAPESCTLADSSRAGDTLQLDSAAPPADDKGRNLASYENFAL